MMDPNIVVERITMIFAIVLLLMLSVAPTRASEMEHQETAICIAQASAAFRIPETPLWVILDVERGQVGKISRNTNGTYDIGPMQINSIWLSTLSKMGVSRDDVLNNRCINIYVAAWIFTKEYQRFGDLGKAIAHYHSPTAKHQRRYLGLIQKAIDRRIAKLARTKSSSRKASAVPGPSVAAAALAKPPTISSTSGMK